MSGSCCDVGWSSVFVLSKLSSFCFELLLVFGTGSTNCYMQSLTVEAFDALFALGKEMIASATGASL